MLKETWNDLTLITVLKPKGVRMSTVLGTPIFVYNMQCINSLFLITGSNLRAIYQSSVITTSNITVWWNHPNQDSDLVQSYNISLREYDNTFSFQTSVNRETNFTFVSSFPPSYLYYFQITSVIDLKDPTETILVRSSSTALVIGETFH